jgi:predicted nucleic acid-binding protein
LERAREEAWIVIVADTSVLIDHLRRRDSAPHAIDAAFGRGEDILASVMSKVEIITGMRTHERRATRSLFDLIRWVPLDDATAELAGEYGRLYRRSHAGIEPPDYVIAATVTRLGGELWTRNVKHFPMFPDLEAPY